MSLFNIKTAQENAIKRVIVKKVQEPIFDKYVRTTLEKIEQSISDANGRYNEGKAYAKAKPSQNWKVVNKTESLEQEEVRVWLKIGVKKQGLYLDDNGNEVFETKIPSSALLDTLNEFKQSVEFVRDNRDSDVAKEFWKEAIEAAKPKSAPKTEGKTGWSYDEASDNYVAV
jgi:maltodextrin utilization protein YvdJ